MYASKYTVGLTLLTLMSGRIASVRASLADFDPFTTPNGEGCVDPQGFRDCFKENVENFVDCGDNHCKTEQQMLQSEQECLSGCKTIQLQSNLVCWVQSCWNQVYSCEYQLTAVRYLEETVTRTTVNGGVPFYPAPDGADGACSCNLGYVEGNQTLVSSTLPGCTVVSQESPSQGLDCLCCGNALGLSGLSICPKADLSFMGLGAADVDEIVADLGSPNNCAILDKNVSVCESTYKIPVPNVPVVNPYNLPPPGTEPVTNLPGNAFTDGGNEVVTISLEDGNFQRTVTLAPWNTDAGAVTATGTGTAAGATGTAAGNSRESSAAEMVVAQCLLWSGGLVAFLSWSLW